MITLKEFRERRNDTLTQSLAEVSFRQLFEQWVNLDGKLTHGETAGYSSEMRNWMRIVGISRAVEIMDEVRDEIHN